jgi:DNA-binding PadR family transcriptional regulator
MSTGYVLLGLLTGGPKHGYELKRAHDARLPGTRPVAFGQVYASLGRLERDGLVEPAGTDRAGGPDRASFRITPAGREALIAWLGTIEPPTPHVSGPLFTRTMVALVAGGDGAARDYLIRQRAAHAERLREWTAVKSDPESGAGDVIAADYAIVHLDADLRWLQTTLERISHLGWLTGPAQEAPEEPETEETPEHIGAQEAPENPDKTEAPEARETPEAAR